MRQPSWLPPIPATASRLAEVDVDDLVQHLQRGFLRTLEGIAANDAAVGAAVADAAHLLEHAVEVLRLAAGEHHHAPAVEGGLHDVLDALGKRRAVDLLVALLC